MTHQLVPFAADHRQKGLAAPLTAVEGWVEEDLIAEVVRVVVVDVLGCLEQHVLSGRFSNVSFFKIET